MAEAGRLERFLAVPTDEGADITIEVEGRSPVTMSVTLEQVEDMLDTLDEILDASDADDEYSDDEDEDDEDQDEREER
ncbi:hypothetical protein [Microvirga pudoricolor]|uniref:hypothetical protein n=1 Tax=Microvirga pudoricolor TaxID=2778729 RepID=UPI00194E271E|nr:hypothetical protein [Microvirga pudoricolor]MBM6592620.1 hypothetical protein [Microvirga pudoricolor]